MRERSQPSLAHQYAAHESWARTADRAARTAPARRAADERFLQLVDPNGEYPPEVRAQMAEQARRAHFLKMAARSAEVRRARSRGGADLGNDA